MSAEKLAKEIADEFDAATGKWMTAATKAKLRAITRKHIEKMFRMAEATIKSELSKVRVSDD